MTKGVDDVAEAGIKEKLDRELGVVRGIVSNGGGVTIDQLVLVNLTLIDVIMEVSIRQETCLAKQFYCEITKIVRYAMIMLVVAGIVFGAYGAVNAGWVKDLLP